MDLARVVWNGRYLDDLWPLWVAFLASAIGAYPMYKLLIYMNSRQTVSQYAPETHQKKQGTPTMGGLIVVYGFLFAWNYIVWRAPRTTPSSLDVIDLAIPILFIGFAVIGFVDDFVVPRMFPGKRGLGWKQKILMQFVVASIFAYLMARDSFEAAAVTIFLILFFSNAFNFADGLDALAGSLLLGFAGGLIGIEIELGMGILNGSLLALVGAIIPFLFLNRPKAKLFMGDVGSLPIGAILGASVSFLVLRPYYAASTHWRHSLHIGSPSFNVWSPAILCIAVLIASGMMIVELLPPPLQILSVKLRKKKLFSYTPIHHAFERKGWPEVKVLAAFVLCQLVLSAIALGLVYVEVVMKRPTGNVL